ncbi:hypothetical protein MRQ36_01345 [Micromonospora sp. R77]|uniref:hypothetical protein n=1 Tax=Micromonospora sp. R77 TaxID=2925836 RepID=UPI001F607343|nr:hypothetical protein [Micromonospora sp. R77]MCI4061290.1 hypothetical protein [Micromonospora sp. R77]
MKKALLLAAVVVVVAGSVGTFVWNRGGGAEKPAELTGKVVVLTTADPGEAERLTAVTRVVEGLPAQFAAADTSALAAGSRDQFGDVRKALPAGTTLAVDGASWRRTGSVASVLVTATPPGAKGTRFRLVVIQEEGAWRVLSTTAA